MFHSLLALTETSAAVLSEVNYDSTTDSLRDKEVNTTASEPG